MGKFLKFVRVSMPYVIALTSLLMLLCVIKIYFVKLENEKGEVKISEFYTQEYIPGFDELISYSDSIDTIPFVRCTACKSDSVFIRMYHCPNTDEVIYSTDKDSVFCTDCKDFTNYELFCEKKIH